MSKTTTTIDPNNSSFYLSVIAVALVIAVPEWFRHELGSIMYWLLSIVVWVELLFCLLVAWFVYKFGTGVNPSTIKVDIDEGEKTSLDFVKSFAKEEGPTHFYFTRLRNIMYLAVGFISIVVLIPMIKNGSFVAILAVIAAATLCSSGVHASLKAYKVALSNLARKIEIV